MKSMFFTLPLFVLSNLFNFNKVDYWNIVRPIFGTRLKNYEVTQYKNETVFKVFYPKGSYSPSKNPVGGVGFFASPKQIFMANEVIFKYQVLFDKSFDPVSGGKLPGLFIGKGIQRKDMTGASGGTHTNAASCRIAWRTNLTAEAYVYVPQQQHQNYYNISGLVLNEKFGDSLWRGLFHFYKTIWNDVSIRLKMNTFTNGLPNYDGELEITINNITQKFNQFIWRIDPNYTLSAIIFETFFGGSQATTATPNDTWTYFKNIKLQKLG